MSESAYWMQEERAREMFKDILPAKPKECPTCHQALPFGGAFQSLIEMEVRMVNGFKVIYDPDIPRDEVHLKDYQGKLLQVFRLTPKE